MLLSGGQEDVFLHAPLGPPAGQLQRVGGGLGQGALLQQLIRLDQVHVEQLHLPVLPQGQGGLAVHKED